MRHIPLFLFCPKNTKIVVLLDGEKNIKTMYSVSSNYHIFKVVSAWSSETSWDEKVSSYYGFFFWECVVLSSFQNGIDLISLLSCVNMSIPILCLVYKAISCLVGKSSSLSLARSLMLASAQLLWHSLEPAQIAYVWLVLVTSLSSTAKRSPAVFAPLFAL